MQGKVAQLVTAVFLLRQQKKGDAHLNVSCALYSSELSSDFSVFPSAVIHDVSPFALA